jgi:uncharacterized protein (DUF697 family)
MTKTLPKLRNPTLDDIKRTATAATPPGRDIAVLTPPIDDAQAPAREPPPPTAIAPAASAGDRQRFEKARRVVSYYRNWTIAAAAAPIPLADAALISVVQLRMVSRLASLYGVPFEKVRVVSLLSALFGGWTPYTISLGVAGAAARMAPGLGTLVGIATSVGTSTLATETIGKVFVRHFEEGGTFLDFEPQKYRNEIAKSQRQGRDKNGVGGKP